MNKRELHKHEKAMMAEKQAFLRPWMVYGILDEAGLLGRRKIGRASCRERV